MHNQSSRISLTPQELEFATACKEFVIEFDQFAGQQLLIENGEFVVPDAAWLREIVLRYGLARLLKVFRSAIEHEAVEPEMVHSLIAKLAGFKAKIGQAFSANSSRDQLH